MSFPNFCEIMLKILVYSGAGCGDPFFTGCFILAKIEGQGYFMGSLCQSGQVGDGDIVAVTNSKLVDLVSHQQRYSIVAGYVLYQGYSPVPETKHKGVVMPVKSHAHLGVFSLFHKMQGGRKTLPVAAVVFAVDGYFHTPEKREAHGDQAFLTGKGFIGPKQVVDGQAHPKLAGIEQGRGAGIHIFDMIAVGTRVLRSGVLTADELIAEGEILKIKTTLGVQHFESGYRTPFMIELDVIGIGQANVGGRQVAVAGLFPEKYGTNTAVDRMQIMVV